MASVLRDVESSALSVKEKALYRFVEQVNEESHTVGPADAGAVRAAGWDDEAIHDAIMVCALFNFYNRWIDATGVHGISDELARASAERMRAGYLR